jgi:hypothetical protein
MCGLALATAVCASVLIAAPADSAVAAQPHGLVLLINGHKLPITPFGGPDRYTRVKPAIMHVVAKWKTNLQGTGYKVVISTREPHVRTYRTCTTGTVCAVRQAVPIVKGQEFSWMVRIVKVQPHLVKVLSGFMVCLVGA